MLVSSVLLVFHAGCGTQHSGFNQPPLKQNPPNAPEESQRRDNPQSPDTTQFAADVYENLHAFASHCSDFHCVLQQNLYPEPIHFYIPSNLQADNRVLVLFYFHGWWTDANSSPFQGVRGDFRSFSEMSASNSIIIVPESRGQNTTYKDYFTNSTKSDYFFRQQIDVLKKTLGRDAKLSFGLSGHSGAYNTLDRIGTWRIEGTLDSLKNLEAFILLDSLYGYRKSFVELASLICSDASGRFYVALNPDDGQKEKLANNRRLARQIESISGCNDESFRYKEDSSTWHLDFAKNHLPRALSLLKP